jgi:hypothetical protein
MVIDTANCEYFGGATPNEIGLIFHLSNPKQSALLEIVSVNHEKGFFRKLGIKESIGNFHFLARAHICKIT